MLDDHTGDLDDYPSRGGLDRWWKGSACRGCLELFIDDHKRQKMDPIMQTECDETLSQAMRK